MSLQHGSVSQGQICSDKFMCCHTETEAADALSTSPTHSFLTTNQPLIALTLLRQTSGMVATGVPIFKSLVRLDPEKFPQVRIEACISWSWGGCLIHEANKVVMWRKKQSKFHLPRSGEMCSITPALVLIHTCLVPCGWGGQSSPAPAGPCPQRTGWTRSARCPQRWIQWHGCRQWSPPGCPRTWGCPAAHQPCYAPPATSMVHGLCLLKVTRSLSDTFYVLFICF